ncbi:hypothetical protein QWY86_11440 [Pedobacter aquatilis]|uniref:hypothetical protein n=1 Tax=Pedobacter aquatilis TaxID=351343 RepID=UPI0025B4052D|nr:hypothetical protein [Pedobacter aquatilis]MDN3587285.1 hypothetical protein [Pedobacter aquatilis]
MKYTSVTFFYPSNILGGAEFLFLRMASVLIDKYNIDVNYVDYEEGFAKNYEQRNVKINFIEYKRYRNQTALPENTLVVAPLSSLLDVSTYLKVNQAHVLFWSIHPAGLIEFFNELYRRIFLKFSVLDKLKVGRIIKILNDHNAINFMDRPNFEYQERVFNLRNIHPTYLPIPLDEKKNTGNIIQYSTINLGWVGRLSEDKIYSLLNILQCCNIFLENNPKDQIQFHIIGAGSKYDLIKELIISERLEIIHQTNLDGYKLQNYLSANIHVLFAMGTSALEGASLNIATLLVDFSYKAFRTNNFRWLYEAEGYSLGDPFDIDRIYNNTFDFIIDQIKTSNIKFYASKCHQYFNNNHSLDIIAKRFLVAVDKTTMAHSELEKTELKAYFWINKLRTLIHYIKFVCKKSY